jgi:transcriptional regulator with XRE-family HTH domain
MRLSSAKLEALREAKGLTLNALLRISGVSKTAYYHLLNKESVLPRSLESLAAALGVKASAFLAEGEDAKRRMMRLLRRAERVRRHESGLDPENIRHVLLLLEDRPIDRLRRSLIRAQKPDLRV